MTVASTAATPAVTTAPHPAPLSPRLYALVPCAGSGSRAGAAAPKQYASVAGRSVVGHTLVALAGVARLHATLVVLSPDDAWFMTHVDGYTGWVARCGGATRAESVAHGLAELARRGAADCDWVLVHDAARCLLRPQWADALIDACIDDPVGGLLALPVADTLKREGTPTDGVGASSGGAGRVAATVDRVRMWQAQTPQMFRLGLLREALARAASDGIAVTDESSAVEAMGHAPRLVEGDAGNFKLTWPADFARAAEAVAAVAAHRPA